MASATLAQKQQDLQNDRLLSDVEAAPIVGVAAQTLRIWRCKKCSPIPYLKLNGRLVRYRMSDLVRFVEKSTVKASA